MNQNEMIEKIITKLENYIYLIKNFENKIINIAFDFKKEN